MADADEKQATARLYMRRDLDDALGQVEDARKLLPHAGLSNAHHVLPRLDEAIGALKSAREAVGDHDA